MESELFGSGLSSLSGEDLFEKERDIVDGKTNIFQDNQLDSQDELEIEQDEEIVDQMPFYDEELGKEAYLTRLPNFFSVEPVPFDACTYEMESNQDEFLDDEGRVRLKLKMENTIRSRFIKSEAGSLVRESNSRVIRWSDGSMTLHIGSEIFDIIKMPLSSMQNQAFIKQGQLLVFKGLLEEKIGFKPHSTSSETHKRVTLGVADRISRSQKIRLIPAAQMDPERQKIELIQAEEQRIRTENKEIKKEDPKSKSGSGDEVDSLFNDEMEDIENKLHNPNQSEDSIFSEESKSSDDEVLLPSSTKNTSSEQ